MICSFHTVAILLHGVVFGCVSCIVQSEVVQPRHRLSMVTYELPKERAQIIKEEGGKWLKICRKCKDTPKIYMYGANLKITIL